MAHRRKLLVDPADEDSVTIAIESLKGESLLQTQSRDNIAYEVTCWQRLHAGAGMQQTAVSQQRQGFITTQ